eukprot:TRINITY_DN9855_c0_g1_i1.p1 TRINITY_DN9855_c0_g1~~TRINITY_DN9855_c0_g1_i1.p1  ORF type:complete len:439 (+),score=29.42 TRINITY_DN9855_c0_g1_i1:115-1431(+)
MLPPLANKPPLYKRAATPKREQKIITPSRQEKYVRCSSIRSDSLGSKDERDSSFSDTKSRTSTHKSVVRQTGQLTPSKDKAIDPSFINLTNEVSTKRKINLGLPVAVGILPSQAILPGRRIVSSRSTRSIIQRQRSNVSSDGPPKITAKSWAILDVNTGTLLHGKKETIQREFASITKVMTCLVSCRLIREMEIDPSDTFVQVCEAATKCGGTTANLVEGDFLSIWDLLHGALLPSGNDAAWTLAENFGIYLFYNRDKFKGIVNELGEDYLQIANPVQYFLEEMNILAAQMKLTNTCFASPTGLSNIRNKSTASDLTKLCLNALQDPWISQIVACQSYECIVSNRYPPCRELDYGSRRLAWENTNKLLSKEGYYGVKTGITPNAGPCLSSAFKQGDFNIIIVILNSLTADARWGEIQALVDWALKKHNSKLDEANSLG